MKPLRVICGCEASGVVREAFRTLGHDAWSCDIRPAEDGSPYHLQCDVLTVMNDGWDIGIFHPDCTYLTNSAEWAYKDADFERYPEVGYHQRVKPGTLTGGGATCCKGRCRRVRQSDLGSRHPRRRDRESGWLPDNAVHASESVHPPVSVR